MGIDQTNNIVPQNERSFTEQWFSDEMGLAVGVYQLVYDGQWHCAMAGEDCFHILHCTDTDFWNVFQNLSVRTSYEAEETTVSALLQKIVNTRKSQSFMHIRTDENGRTHFIRGTLSIAYGQQEQLCVLGQMADVSGEHDREVQPQLAKKEDERKYTLENAGLLQVAQITFPEIVTINLTQSTYRLIRRYGDEAPELLLEGDLQQMLDLRVASVFPADQQAFRDVFFPEKLMEAAQQGKKQVQLTYRRAGEDGVYHWIETTLMRQENPYDEDILIVAVSCNVDAEKEQERKLQELVRQQAEELALTVRQMDKHISYFDVATSTLTMSPATAELFDMPAVIENYPEYFFENPPSGYGREALEQLRPFIDAIRRGDSSGSYDYSAFQSDGSKIWMRREFNTIFDDAGNPVRAVLSSEDVTEQYEYVQKRETGYQGILKLTRLMFPEILFCNLTKNTCEVIQGMLGEPVSDNMDALLDAALENIMPQDREEFKKNLFRENLIKAMEQGQREFRVTYRERVPDGSWHWIETTALRQEDPYNNDILIFAASRYVDAEKEQERKLQELVRQQAEELALTMRQMGKYISYYDVATSTMTTAPNTAKQLGIPTVLENYPECHLVDPPAGYARADVEKLQPFFDAIRHGNPYGTYDYSMVKPDGSTIWLRREFNTIFDDAGNPVRAVLSSEDVTEQYKYVQKQETDRAGLLKVTQLVFPEILSCNLTQNTCEVIQSTLGVSKDIPLDAFLVSRLDDIAPEDHEAFQKQFFRENQLKAMEKGRERFQLTYRRRNPDGSWHWIETIAFRNKSTYTDDVLTFAVSRNVDLQKAQEERLRQALADSVDKFDGWHYYNRLTSRTYGGLTYVHYPDDRPSPYVVGGLAHRLDCPEKELALGTCFRIPKEDEGVVQNALKQAKQAGEKSFRADYRIETDRGEIVWVHNYATEFTDKHGDTGYIHFLTDTTREHALTEQVRLHMEERLKESQQIFGIVAQHSNRTLYQHNLATGTITPWDENNASKDLLSHVYTGFHSIDELDKNPYIMPESLEDVKQFFTDIRSGVPAGEMNMHIKMLDDQIRWYHVQYTSFFDGNTSVTSLISVEDITERHEHEIAYLRHAQSVMDNVEHSLLNMEGCLVCDRVERLSGSMLSEDETNTEYSYSALESELLDKKFIFEERDAAKQYFSIDNLLNLYNQGERQLNGEWKTRFSDGTTHWLRIEIVLTADPFNEHVKAFIRVVDNTDNREKHQSLLHMAEYDAMSGLLRRGVGETRIREYLSAHAQPGGILIALDLDDLKGINDTLGHNAGDAAISGIAKTLKSHFRKDDILIRAGGDEFLVFLPGAGKSVSSVELSLTSLLRKLSALSIGDNNERTIHCSIGCAVELPDTDTFDSLYQRADIALYHVKRSGKNNYMFFEPAMLEENYRIKLRQAVPVVSEMIKNEKLWPLMEVLSIEYPGIVQFNLTRNYFRILTTGNNVDHVHAPDQVNVFWENWRENIHPDDWENVISILSREELLTIYTQGKRRFKHFYRNKESVGYVRTEVDVRFFAAENGDIGAFLFFRWDTGSEKDMEIQRLNKLLSLSGIQDFEYVCVIDVRDKSYSTFSNDGENSHLIPETADFDTVTKHIRDTQISKKERSAYYEHANLDHILEQMNKSGDSYSYQYIMTDGITREAAFTWYEGTHAELLMTVRKI